MASEKRGYANVKKVPFQRTLQQITWETSRNTVEISTTEPLPDLLIPVKAIQVEKVSLSNMQNIRTVF